jgi:uncharacterized radical SAM protein YgiQ
MGEQAILEIARRLATGETIESIRDVQGTCVRSSEKPKLPEGTYLQLPDYEEIKESDDPSLHRYAEHFMLQKRANEGNGKLSVLEKTDQRWVLQNPSAPPMESDELDHLYELPFTRKAHPLYNRAGGIPALREVEFSLISNRGCYGGCSFCAITYHQGRIVRGRSTKSLVKEAQTLTLLDGFKGYIHDVGGPTANFNAPACVRQEQGSACPNRECLFPEPCPLLRADHRSYLETLRELRKLPRVKKVFIRSGIRFDYLLLDKRWGKEFLDELCAYHVSGQLKVAPEHVSASVLEAMGKANHEVYEEFRRRYAETNKRMGMDQYLIPYFISAHPGSTLNDAIELALYLKKTGFVPDQAQDFYPTPGTLSTVMYHTGLDPRSMEKIHVARGERERRMQRALLQFNHRENRKLVIEALREAGREDLLEILV